MRNSSHTSRYPAQETEIRMIFVTRSAFLEARDHYIISSGILEPCLEYGWEHN